MGDQDTCTAPASEPKRLKVEETSEAADVPHEIVAPQEEVAATTGDTAEAPTKSARPAFPKKMVVLLISYLGEKYSGLQRNPGVITIEDVLENALAEAGAISDANRGDFKKIAWNRCARTDKGVSAIGNIISCRLVQIPNLLEEANKRLPEDIRIMGIQRVTNNFNSRLRADSRWYEYILPAYVFAPHVVNADPATFPYDKNFKFSEELRARINEVLAVFVGTHNFHNYSSGINPNDAEAKRFIMSFACGDPFEVSGIQWVPLSVIGQSFIFNQIRKMVAMAVTVIRDKQPLAVMKAYMVPEKKLSNLQLAPGEGLFLRECLFKYYNEKATEPINWEPIRDKLDNFRNQVIIPHLATKEINDNMFTEWLKVCDTHPIQYEEVLKEYFADGNDQRKL